MLRLGCKGKVGFFYECKVGLAFVVVKSFEFLYKIIFFCMLFTGAGEDYRVKVYDVAEMSVDRNGAEF